MFKNIISYAGVFVVAVLLQIFVLDNISLGVYDAMTGTDGLNVIAATAVGFFRPLVINATCGRTVGPDDTLPALYRITTKSLAWYIGVMVMLHCAIFFFMETLSLRHLPHILLRLAVSGAATFLLAWYFVRLFIEKILNK